MTDGSVTAIWRLSDVVKDSYFGDLCTGNWPHREKEQYMEFNPDAAKIKRWRDERYWSQEHLADLAGIGLRTVQRIENGEQASRESVMALAAAFGVEAIALTVDPQIDQQRKVLAKKRKDAGVFRLSFLVHLIGYLLGMVIFIAISVGVGGPGFAMKWPMLWWTVGLAGHGAAVALVYLALRYEQANLE